MLKIGEFSRYARLSIRMLRHYDAEGGYGGLLRRWLPAAPDTLETHRGCPIVVGVWYLSFRGVVESSKMVCLDKMRAMRIGG